MQPTLDLDTLWETARERVLPSVTSPAQRNWLAAARPVGSTDTMIIVSTPHAFAREWIEAHLGDPLTAALTEAAGRPMHAMITVQPNPEPDPVVMQVAEPEPPAASPEPPAQTDTTGAPNGLHAPGRPDGPTVFLDDGPTGRADEAPEGLNPSYRFEDFVIGASNRFAHAAATTVAEAPAKSYNPLFIYGRAGLGKTHLLHAVGNYINQVFPRLKVRYVTSEQFTNEFIRSIRSGQQSHFQSEYRGTDILLIDDIQFLESKEGTQEEFFHTFNDLHNSGGQIVIASDRPPQQMTQLDDRLTSRFQWGLQVDIQPPDLETRIAILESKAERDQLYVPTDVCNLIAERVDTNIRELEGALIRVHAFASLQKRDADIETAEMVLKDVFPGAREQEITVSLIMEVVSEFFDFTIEELCSSSRSRQLTTSRQIAMYLTRELTEMSLPRIGKAFGGRDHTTVMHANRKIAGLMKDREPIFTQIQEVTNRIKTRARGA